MDESPPFGKTLVIKDGVFAPHKNIFDNEVSFDFIG
jgi:hypothetical protein